MRDFFFVIIIVALSLWGIFNFGVLEYEYEKYSASYNRLNQIVTYRKYPKKELTINIEDYYQFRLYQTKKNKEFFSYLKYAFATTTLLWIGLSIFLYIKYRTWKTVAQSQKQKNSKKQILR